MPRTQADNAHNPLPKSASYPRAPSRTVAQAFKSRIFRSALWNRIGKDRDELAHWRGVTKNIIGWYEGRAAFRLPFPTSHEKVTRFDLRTNAIMTYILAETHHASYLTDLQLDRGAFRGERVADIGSGPFPTLLVFEGCERYGIDHLMNRYGEIGFPLARYGAEQHFINAKSENIPLEDNFFDVVLSRNALDHVDDFETTCCELRRVLKPEGMLHLLLNYHLPTRSETQELSDERVLDTLGSLDIRKVSEQRNAWGFDGGTTVLWSTHPERIVAG